MRDFCRTPMGPAGARKFSPPSERRTPGHQGLQEDHQEDNLEDHLEDHQEGIPSTR